MERYSQEAEEYVLSGMMANEQMLCLGVETLAVTDFYSGASQAIFCALKKFYDDNETPSLQKLILEMRGYGELEKIGGVGELTTRVCKYVSTEDDFNYYANEVKSNSILRQMGSILNVIKEKIDGNENMSGFDLLAKCKILLEKIGDFQTGGLGVSFKDECVNVYIPKLLEGKKENEEISTGFVKLDELVSGMGGGQIWTICARTGVGKTTLALNMALNLAKSGKNVYMFSLEMTKDELAQRLMSQLSEIPHEKIKEHDITHEEIYKIQGSLDCLSSSSLIINDKGGLKVNELCSIARKVKSHYALSAIFIDYIQLIEANSPTEFRHLEIAQITRRLKKLAKDLNIPIIALAQLSRKVEERATNSVYLSDLKESGSIEEDSDVVLAIIRRDMKDPFDRPGEASIAVLKNRHGASGEVRMRFDKERCRFEELFEASGRPQFSSPID